MWLAQVISKFLISHHGDPGLQDISDLFPPSASSSLPVTANIFMKLPVFWPDTAKVWFAQGAPQFAIRNVTVSITKFYHAVAVLPQILDLIHPLLLEIRTRFSVSVL